MHDEQIMYAGKRTQIKSVEFMVYFILCTAKKKKGFFSACWSCTSLPSQKQLNNQKKNKTK